MNLRRLDPIEVGRLDRGPVEATTLAKAAEIVEAVRRGGETAVRRYAESFLEIAPGDDLVLDRPHLERVLAELPSSERDLLDRTAERIEAFAEAQRDSLRELTLAVEGGQAGQSIAAVRRAGCYAPGGRYPLPSTVLMTAVTARVAGVDSVVVASPKPATVTLAAAAVAGADAVLTIGGAHAIAALAFGFDDFESCDVVVGPGNRWVTAAKKLVAGSVGIDMLAGPSELVVLADDSADPVLVASDLLAQAEHDPDALPVLVTLSEAHADAVDAEIDFQLADLPTVEIASRALANGFCCVAPDLSTAMAVCDRLAPEHLQVMTENAGDVAHRLKNWGGLFIGSGSAEVLGDYGAGPNHTLPTGGVARFKGGLSVFDFLRVRTWLEIDDSSAARQLMKDSSALARLEGLEAHARAAGKRLEKLAGRSER
jgi:phosphoribosyl-ATP pyrophosphohydrolase/phosphoribosyl-AMP cyclohydrolase/histidinol dehydrogenase